jgi:aspartyl-tRNA(Asn)/glutamyl-tRNA(Gln) amidotransferase subunit A
VREVKRRIVLGTYVLSAGYYDAFYLKALQVRTLMRRDLRHAFERADVVAMPTSPIPPFKLGEKTDDPLQMYPGRHLHGQREPRRAARHHIPCGFADACRLAFQFWASVRRADDPAAADALSSATDWHRRTPEPGESGCSTGLKAASINARRRRT